MKTILVAIDFSPISEKLLAEAEQFIDVSGKIYLVHVAAPDPDFVGYSVGPQYIRDERAHQLQEEHHKLNALKNNLTEKGFDAEALLVGGPTVETLLNEVEKLQADLLIIGKKGHSLLHDVIIGSVCNDVIKHIKIKALVVPA